MSAEETRLERWFAPTIPLPDGRRITPVYTIDITIRSHGTATWGTVSAVPTSLRIGDGGAETEEIIPIIDTPDRS